MKAPKTIIHVFAHEAAEGLYFIPLKILTAKSPV